MAVVASAHAPRALLDQYCVGCHNQKLKTAGLDPTDGKLQALTNSIAKFGGTTDVIAPIASVEAITSVLTGAPSVRFEKAPGSHLGLVAGPTARDSTWAHIDEFLKEDAPQLVSTS